MSLEPSNLECNACWSRVTTGKAYKTQCQHLYCTTCAHRFFQRKMMCPLCEVRGQAVPVPRGRPCGVVARAPSCAVGSPVLNCWESSALALPAESPAPATQTKLENDGGIIEMYADTSAELAGVVLGYFSFHPEEAFRLASDATAFTRGQIAISGQRLAWAKDNEMDSTKRCLVELENKLNTVMSELGSKAKEAADLMSKLQLKVAEKEDTDRKLKLLSRLYEQVTGRPGATAQALASAGPGRAGGGQGGSSFGLGQNGATLASLTPMRRGTSSGGLLGQGLSGRPQSPGGSSFGSVGSGGGGGHFNGGSFGYGAPATPLNIVTTGNGGKLNMLPRPPPTPLGGLMALPGNNAKKHWAQ
jgi:hypothetical protein